MTSSCPDLFSAPMGPILWAPPSPTWPQMKQGPRFGALILCREGAGRDAVLPVRATSQGQNSSRCSLTLLVSWGPGDINSQRPSLLRSPSHCCPVGTAKPRHRKEGQGGGFAGTGRSLSPGCSDIPGHAVGTHLLCAHMSLYSPQGCPPGQEDEQRKYLATKSERSLAGPHSFSVPGRPPGAWFLGTTHQKCLWPHLIQQCQLDLLVGHKCTLLGLSRGCLLGG